MKVLMISDVYFPRINGVSASIETFRRDLKTYGFETLLVAPAYDGRIESDETIIRIPSRYLPLDPEDRLMKLAPVRDLIARLRGEAIDLVHIQTPFVAHYAGIEFSDILQVPRIETYHTFFEEYLFHYAPFVPRRLMRALARRFSRRQCNELDALIVPSTAMHEVLAEYGVTRPIHVQPTGIPLDRFKGGDGMAFRREHGILPDRPTVLYVGRVAFEKNIQFLLRASALAVRSIPDLLFVLTGEGPALNALKRLANELGMDSNVRFLGYLDRSNALLDCYRAADAFVFASRTETQGLVLLEAMACGVPVIAIPAMGTRDILAAGRGASVSEDNEADFAAKIVQLMADGALRTRLRIDALSYVQEWCASTMAQRLGRLYRKIALG